MGTALEAGEHRAVDRLLVLLLVEDHAAAGAAEGLVRGGGDDVAVLEGLRLLLGGDEAGDVGHVHHEHGAALVRNLAKLGVLPVAGVRGAAADDHLGPEVHGLLLELGEVDVAGGRVELVREGLEEDGGGGDLLLGGVESVREVAAVGQVEAHDPVVGVEERGVHGHVGGGTGVRLHVDAPLGLVEAVSGERAVLAEDLDLVDVLVTAVVARAGETLGVLVGEARAQSLHHGRGGEVLGRDELDAADLTELLLLDELVDLGIGILEGLEGLGEDGFHLCLDT
mmetsp:Transcript_4311/g.19240  ORF Transcript_4311/g.19240 Transcript_4311/m.19240 type:complete len:282 (-) Transcript_4311:28-873(-)